MAEKKRELAQLQLELDHLTNTCEELKKTADSWQQRARELVEEKDEKVNECHTINQQFSNFAKAVPTLLRKLGGENTQTLEEMAVLQRRIKRNENICHNLADFIENAVQDAPPNGVLSAEAIQLLSRISSPPVQAIVPVDAAPLDDAAANDDTLWKLNVFSFILIILMMLTSLRFPVNKP